MNYLSKENVQGISELSLVQKAMLSGDQLTQVAYELQGNLDTKHAEQAWAETVAEHPSLRSVFRRLKNRTVQVLLKKRPIPIEWQDLRGMVKEDQQAAYQSIVNSHRKPIKIDEGPLIRLALCRLDDDQTILLWTHHPLCVDDNSRDMIVNEWLDRVQGTERAFPQRRPYEDYLKWEAAQDEMPAKKYWTEQLADFEPAPMLQTMPGVLEESDSHLRCCGTVLSEELSQRLEQVAKQYHVSVEALSLTAWTLLLNMYSGEERVSCGATVPGRPDACDGAESMIGSFAHALPLRATLSADQQVHELFACFQQQWERLLTFGNIPDEMVRTYAGISEKSLLFDSFVTVRNQTGGSSGQPQYLYRAGQEPMEVMITVGSQWEVELVRPQGVSLQALEVLRRHFVTLLKNIAEQPEAQLRELNLLSDEEELRILQKVNKTRLAAPPLHRLAHQVIEERVAERPDAIAAVCGEESITYGELNNRANQLAYWLRDQGLGRDDIAALLAERSIEMLVGILAVLKAGGAYVPLDSAHPDHRLLTILENSGAKFILTESRLQSRSLELSATLSQTPVVFSFDRGEGGGADVDVLTLYPEGNPALINEPEDLANVFYTSGSTGQPKGAMIEQIGMLNHLYAKINLLGLNEKSVVAQNASHCFDISVWQFLAPLMTGGRVVIYNNDISTDPQALFRSVQSDRVTVLEMVPPMIEMFLQESTEYKSEQRLLPELQYMISTGEGLPVSLCHKWLKTFSHVKVVNTYGATECSDDTSHEVIGGTYQHDDHPQVALGTSIPNIHHYVLDAWQRPVPVGCIGEVYITGIGVGRGYLNDPKRTSEAYLRNPFADGMGERMYKTGDLARLMPDGRLVFVSRADFQVKVRGYRIELGEIEAALLSHRLVSQCLALVRPDESGNNRILAYVVLHEDIDDILELRQYLQAQLPDYMVPEHLIVLQAMPLNRNGKIDRKALPEPDGFGQIATGYTAPRNHWESVLVAIWEEVLGVDRIGIDDNFFNLGGHSLKTIQIRSRIRQQLGVDMELKDLFDHQTVRELAPLLDAAQAGATEKTERIVPAEQADFYPMSHAQQRLFLLHRLEPSNRSYNMPVAVELMGSLDLEVFQQAIQSLQNRHEGLRTTFTVHAGKPVQRVAESLPLDCPLIDLSDRDETAQQQYLEEIGREEAETDFDLTEGPLFRIRLCKLAKDRYVLWMNMHHIISDYWSWQVLIRDFTALYDAFHQGKTPSLPPLTVQYKDYARWQNDRLGRGELAESEAYWLEQFSGDLPILDLPTDHPRPPIQTFTASQATVALGPDRLKRLRGLAQEQEATLFMTLLSAVGAFLSRMSGQQDLVIGTPEAGRNRAELEDLIGFFVNTLPLRLDLRAEQTFTELLQHCKRIALDAYTHHEYPFDRLVEKVKPERDLSRSPIFSVMFQLDQPTIETTLNDLNLRPLPSETHMTNFDLTIVGVETESGLDIQFQYRSDLYEEETVNRWLEQFRVMMDGILMDPTQNISEYPLLTDRQHQLLAEWNDTEVDFPQELVHDRFATIARQMPDQTAVEADGVTLTYRELNDRSERLANFLRRKGIGPDDLVGICMERSVEMMVGLFGILKAGGAYVPLDPAFPEERLKYMLEDSGSQAVLTDQPFISSLVQPDVQIIDMKTVAAEIAAESSERPTIQISGDQIAYVIYTSGSTGKPKGVQVSHRSLANLLTSMEKEPGICADDRFLSVTTLSFDICALELFLPLMVGATVVLVRREVVMDGKRLAKAIKTSGATIMQGTPTMWRLLLTAGWAGSPRLKVLCGGEPLTHELAQKLQMCSAELWNLYGPTETTIWSTVHHVTEQKGPIPIGRPTMNTKLYVLDDWMQPVPIGVPGELYIGGVALARGYHNRPELTAERFVPNPFSDEPGSRLYKTGDRARYLSDGILECLGRVDDQVKLRGYRIEPGEIQGVLIQHPAVAEATVILREDTPGDQRLVAYVTVSEGHELILRDVQRQLADLLPSYMVPSAIVVLDSLPLTLNGKVDHKQLPFPDTPVLQDTYAPPRDLNELDMVRIWEDLLQIKPIGIHDHFFAIGGQSLKALLLLESIRERFGVQLPMTTLFQKPTVAELCVYLDGRTAMNDACLIKLQQGNGTHPPLFFVHPQGGGVLPYVHVIKELGPEETAYGLQAVGYESNDQPLTSIEAMADRYVEEIRRLVPQGPYRLVGWSFGGTVAYEMARQLEDLGEKVDFIGLFDVRPLDRRGERQEEFTERDAMIYFAILFDLDPDPLARMDVEEGLNQLLQRAKERGIWPPSMTLDSMRRKIDVLVACGQAMTDYRYHGPIRSDLHLFRVNQVSKHGHELIDPAEWKPRTAGQVHVFDVPGDHITMADPPNVNVLAKAMKSAWTQVTISPATGGGS